MPQKIIIDTDPGVDDSIAISVALRSPELEVVGLTSVFGNATNEITAQNALRLVELEGHGNIPVARGCDVPLVVELESIASEVHGNDGLGNTHLPAPKGKPINKSAAEFIIDTVRANPGEVMLVPIGPLTNIAVALKTDPQIVPMIKKIVLMGGAVSIHGNISPVAEANIYHDPHAADIVMQAGCPVVMVGLDVTQQVIMTPQFFEEVFKVKNPATNLIKRILPVYQAYHDRFHKMGGSIHTHDPSAIAYVINPALFETRSVPVFVETIGRCKGQTVADEHRQWESRKDIEVCQGVNSAGVLALIKERLTR
ncbi:MAG: nucleoside hydrolase [Pelolinea sp.]|jgi:uridine nucleosidase|nr:nucleoside hydrolase [Pelolinea sp.]